MTTTTTVDSPELAKGVPFSERTRLVTEAHPALIEALEKASREFYQNEANWQEEAERQQRAGGMPKRELESPYGRALREAATAVTDAFDELLAAGAVTWPPVPPDNPVHDGKERM